jgi:hypothetical protein
MNAIRRIAPVLLIGLALGLASPATAQDAEDLEPDITIRDEEERTLREYRVDGELYAIEIVPDRGTAYFLVDQNGDGNFEHREADGVEVPDWVRKRR